MPRTSRPRKGTLQFWPRKRAERIIPSVNWGVIPEEKRTILGFIAYKVGMVSCLVKDNTEHSLTKGQKIVIPATVLECPSMKIFAVRFYKENRVVKDIFVGGEKELKSVIKMPKQKGNLDSIVDYDKVALLVQSVPSETGIKKTPDISEIGLGGKKEEQLQTAKNFLNKEIGIAEVFKDGLVDIRAVSKGKGLQGPVKRFGISLRHHKSEKGVRKVGSIGPWHPARLSFRVAMAGQTGFQVRPVYNLKIILAGKISNQNINPSSGFKHYGNIKSNYLILQGSVPGPAKRAVVITAPLRKTKGQQKKNFELINITK